MFKKRPKCASLADLEQVKQEAHSWRIGWAQTHGSTPDVDIRLKAVEERMELVLVSTTSGYRELVDRISVLEDKIDAEIQLRELNRFDIKEVS